VDDCQYDKIEIKKTHHWAYFGKCCGFFFWWQIFAILQCIDIWKNMLWQTLFFFGGKKNHQKMKEKNPKKFAKSCHNCLQCERVLKIFLLSYFEYQQIWLNIIVNKNSHSRSNIMGPNQQGHIRSPSELGSLVGVFISTFKIHSEWNTQTLHLNCHEAHSKG